VYFQFTLQTCSRGTNINGHRATKAVVSYCWSFPGILCKLSDVLGSIIITLPVVLGTICRNLFDEIIPLALSDAKSK